MTDQHRRRSLVGFSLIELLVAISIIVILIALLLPALGMVRESTRAATCMSGLRQWGMAMRMYLNDHKQHLPKEGVSNQQALDGAWYNELPHYVNARPYKSHYEEDNAGLDASEGYPNDWIWHCPTRIANDHKHSGSGKNAFHYGMNALLNGSGSWPPNYTSAQPHTDTRHITKPACTIFLVESNDQPSVAPTISNHPIYKDPIDRQRHSGDSLNILFIDGHVALFKDHQVPEPELSGAVYRSSDPVLVWGPFKN